MSSLRTLIPFVTLVLPLTVGCDHLLAKYDIIRAGPQTYVLNKHTGDTKLFEGNTLVPVRPMDTTGGEGAKGRTWPPLMIPQLGDIKITLRTKYRDGQLLYIAEAAPYAGRLQKESDATYGRPVFMIDLSDRDGFPAGDALALELRSATKIVNDKGEAYALQWTGHQQMTAGLRINRQQQYSVGRIQLEGIVARADSGGGRRSIPWPWS